MSLADHGFLLLCDLKDSTKLGPEKGGELIGRLNLRLDTLNAAHHAGILLPLELNYGDEIAGLVRSPISAFRIVQALRAEIATSASFRFCVVYGAVGARGGSMRQMGGEVFRTANRLIGELKISNRFGRWSMTDPATDGLLDLLTNLSQALIDRMTRYQFDVYLMLDEGLNQQAIATKLGKFPQSVSDAVRRADIDLVLDTERRLSRLLESYPKPETIDQE